MEDYEPFPTGALRFVPKLCLCCLLVYSEGAIGGAPLRGRLSKSSSCKPEQMDHIEGRVRGAAPGQQIVLYAKNGLWWVRPFKSRPFTPIQSDRTWKSGGEMNDYDSANSWVDSRGYLHLRMGMQGGRWSCAEVNLTRSLGYGTYKFVVQDSANL